MKFKGSLALLFVCLLALFFSCTKINESTQLGDGLIPVVDNVNTFDTTLEVSAAYFPYEDSSRFTGFENAALGRIDDPEFGRTNADIFLNFSSAAGVGVYPFVAKDSVKGIDSVVLSLAYSNAYGDTLSGQFNVEVSEISPTSGFKDDSAYLLTQPGFATTGPVLATKTVSLRSLRTDTIPVIRKGDTSKLVNVLRIRFSSTALGEKLRNFDTVSAGANGAYASDSAFRALFRGLAIKTVNGAPGGLAYFNLANTASKLTVYYRVGKAGAIDSAASADFVPVRSTASLNGQANSVTRTPSANYLANIGNSSSDRLYLQTAPKGSYIGINVPNLSSFPNKVIHLAELTAYAIPSAMDAIYTKPNLLLLAHNNVNRDSVYLFEKDLPSDANGSPNFNSFGGFARTDLSYRYNITRYVQGIVTNKERSDSLRIYAPLLANLYVNTLRTPLYILDEAAKGRVVIANSNYADRSRRLRLRVVYSNL